MKRWTTLLIVICMLGITIPAMGAMSISKMRQNTRFLTDRMAYELKLTPRQYNDVYEVNYDFINNVRYLMDDVVRGYDYALERYYDFLDVRNDDLRWILSSAQYRRFMRAEHFYRPIYAHENKWHFRIYLVYNNVNFFTMANRIIMLVIAEGIIVLISIMSVIIRPIIVTITAMMCTMAIIVSAMTE
mgnify:CR=1 FL=1|jgi:hypothetical protein